MKYHSLNKEQINILKTSGYSKAATLLLGCLFLLFSGCAPSDRSLAPSSSLQSRAGGQLSLFLNLRDTQVPHLQMTIHSIEVLAENSQWLPLIDSPVDADSHQIADGQIFLGRSIIKPGHYRRLRLTTTWKNQPAPEPAVTELEIRNPLYLSEKDSHSLFLTWDVSTSFSQKNHPQPIFTLSPRLKKLLVDVAYVACPEINTVYMIRTDKNWVYDSLGVQGSPTYLISDKNAPTENLFALSGKERSIKRIGPASNRVEETFHLPSTGREKHFTISPDSEWAFIIDRKRGNLLRLNLRSGTIDARTRFSSSEPSYILYLEQQNLLAVALSLSQSVVLLDPQTLRQVQTISTGNKPEGLLLSDDNLLYIAEAGANTVMIYDLVLNKVMKRIPVDFSPRRLLAVNGLIYVSNHDSHSISLLRPGQLGVSKTIHLDGPPLELAFSHTSKYIYLGNGLAHTLDIIDPISSKIVGRIQLGALPGGIAVLE